MNERWDLNPIYTGFDAPEFAADFAAAKDCIERLTAFAAGLPRKDLQEAL